ncbi:At rich interactive domain [Ilyodon furcidens]|uniref:At rich interactive domain n=2 Tax=Goodeidae TaxID=28758 RepID=A0ABV0VAG5_9TELE
MVPVGMHVLHGQNNLGCIWPLRGSTPNVLTALCVLVFDDGDEKTLRRTSLCLKGERHFAESETLDQLPLTNPEHFGTPVIGKKSNRGGRRSSQAVADEENDTSSSEEEEDDKKRLSDELLGQICSIENVEDSADWFMALVNIRS